MKVTRREIKRVSGLIESIEYQYSGGQSIATRRIADEICNTCFGSFHRASVGSIKCVFDSMFSRHNDINEDELLALVIVEAAIQHEASKLGDHVATKIADSFAFVPVMKES